MDSRQRYRQVAELHVANIDQGFLSTLGVGFLELMYGAIDHAPGCWLLVEVDGDDVTGFVAGATGMGAIYARMLRHPFRLVAALAPAMLDARKLRRILEILFYRPDKQAAAGKQGAELLSIAVAPAHRGKKIAERLYHGLAEQFRDHGIREFRITVGQSLAAAHRFYRRMGAVPVAQIEVHAGAPSTLYVQELSQAVAFSKGPGANH